jgi:hypothetical protein
LMLSTAKKSWLRALLNNLETFSSSTACIVLTIMSLCRVDTPCAEATGILKTTI